MRARHMYTMRWLWDWVSLLGSLQQVPRIAKAHLGLPNSQLHYS